MIITVIIYQNNEGYYESVSCRFYEAYVRCVRLDLDTL